MRAPNPLADCLIPVWPLVAGVGAAMSTRQGGHSVGPFQSWNLRPSGLVAPDAVDDDPSAVAANLRRFAAAIGAEPFFLHQVHGSTVLNLDERLGDAPSTASSGHSAGFVQADAAVTTRVGVACTVLVADCLPVLFCDRAGRAVAAAHAGWRGLAAGILEATVVQLCQSAACEFREVQAWLGPCIGPDAFEVGDDVLQAFGRSPEQPGPRFRASPRPDGAARWRADLAGLAHDRLERLGLGLISASGLCTVSDPSRFFSFRRDGLSGRMAASIWRRL